MDQTGEKCDFWSHFSTPSSSDTTSRRGYGRSRQRTGRIRCHRLHFPLGHVQYVYSSFLELALLSSYDLFHPGSGSTEQRSAADTLGFRPKNVTQEMVCLVFYFSDRMRKPRLLTTAPPPDEDSLMQMLIFEFPLNRLTRYPICFRTFQRKFFSIQSLLGRGRSHPVFPSFWTI